MSSSQKFIARNRAPRVQIEYDVELYGAEKKVQLPFVMGVLSDLAGKTEQPAVADRKFLEIDVDNFDERMRSMAPRAAFSVPNTLTGEGNMAVDITFESMDDFSPAAIAAKVPALAPLLEARRQLDNLMAYMDGKSGAEALIENLLAEPALLKALGGGEADRSDMDAALESLKARMPDPAPEDDGTDRTLAALAAKAPEDAPAGPSVDDILGTVEARPEAPRGPGADDVLAGIARGEDGPDTADADAREATLDALRNTRLPEETQDRSDDVLAGIARSAPEEPEPRDEASDVLSRIERKAEEQSRDEAGEVLAGIERRDVVEEQDRSDDVLAGIERTAEEEARDDTGEVLAAIERREETEEADTSDDVLAGIGRREETPEEDATDDILAGLERHEDVVEEDRTDDVLASVERRDEAPDADRTTDVLAGIERRETAAVVDGSSDILAGIERREEAVEADRPDDVLAGIDRAGDADDEDGTDEVLSGIERREPTEEADNSADVLAGIERREEAVEADRPDDVLAGIARKEDVAPEDPADDILASLEPTDQSADEGSDLDEVLAGFETTEDTVSEEDAGPDSASIRDDEADVVAGDLDAPSADEVEDMPSGTPQGKEGDGTADDLDALLADLDGTDDQDRDGDAVEADDLDALFADLDAPSADEVEDIPSGTPRATEGDGTADDLDALLADLDGTDDQDRDGDAVEADDLDALLADLGGDDEPAARSEPDVAATPRDEELAEDLDDLLADTGGGGTSDAASTATGDDLDALLADLGGDDDAVGHADAETGEGEPGDEDATGDLDALLADLGGEAPAATDDSSEDDFDLDALMADLGGDEAPETEDDTDLASADDAGPAAPEDDLDALLADLGASEVGAEPEEDLDSLLRGSEEGDEAADTGDLDDLLADMGTADVGGEAQDDLDALLADLTGGDAESERAEADTDLDALLADMGTTDLGEETAALAEAPAPEAKAEIAAVPAQSPYGTISAPQPERDGMNRDTFRMAIFGDFTGRASRGLMETGDALAARRPILLDVDTVEDVIEGFATTLTLPIGKDGAGIEVKLEELDDLHPDELYEKVEIFEAIAGLRQQLSVGSMAGRATEQLKGWAEEFGTPVKLPKRSAATSVPPDLKLSDFQALIGDTRGTLTKATPADDLIARIVGPHVVKGPDAGAAEMLEAVDEALSAAMRLVLHHPDFQAVESQWRSLDLLARRIETDSELQIVLYDVSAEEMAADLSAQEDLAKSGLYRLLTEVMDPEDGDGGFSALFGLYTFEETPPHAELLARIGLVAAHVDTPFFAAITPAYLETPKEERHKLVAEAWDRLRALPQAAYLGLASPRFMLRQPYGAKSDPCYEFEFEEFTAREGLKGLLWANPVVLVAILLAATWKKDGKAMELGSLMSLGDIPFTYVTDRYGDQVALPCTERNLTSDAAQATLLRGYMPVLSMKGRNEIRLGSFRSLGGAEIAGPWSGDAPARPAPPQPTLEMDVKAAGAGAAAAGAAGEDPLAEPGGLPDTGAAAETDGPGDALDLLDSGDDDDGQSLDDLLASFADDGDAADDDDDMDPELAALLEGL